MWQKFRLIICWIRLKIIKLLHPSSHLTTEGFSDISIKSDIEIGRASCLKIGRGLHTRKNVLCAVRDNARLTFGDNVFINRNTIIVARESISIGSNVTIGPNVCVYDHDHNIIGGGM